MTEKYRAVAIEGTPDTPCGMVRLLVETNDGLISILTPEGPAENGVTRERFCDRANEGFATWFFPKKESVEVERDWYALYLREELAKAVGGFDRALNFSPRSVEKQSQSAGGFMLVPEKPGEMRERGWVIILGTSQRLWRFRKEWAEKLLELNQEDNLRYLKTGKETLSEDIAEKKRLLDAIEKRARLGIYCTEPEVTPSSYLKFALELGLVMTRHRDQDTCRRVYKYHVERFYPRMSWDEFEKEVLKLREEYQWASRETDARLWSLNESEAQLTEKKSQEPQPDDRQGKMDGSKTERKEGASSTFRNDAGNLPLYFEDAGETPGHATVH